MDNFTWQALFSYTNDTAHYRPYAYGQFGIELAVPYQFTGFIRDRSRVWTFARSPPSSTWAMPPPTHRRSGGQAAGSALSRRRHARHGARNSLKIFRNKAVSVIINY
ncbi:MAG: hypothetical protein JO163_05560 [Methylobacteriaceae bacterium]|nr:hypothetical protein [Methylobacteriaceae bacterium]